MDSTEETSAETKNDLKTVATPTTAPSAPSTPSSSSRPKDSGGKKLYYQQDALTNAAMKMQFDIFVRQSLKSQQILRKLDESGLKQKLVASVLSAETRGEESEGLLNRRILPEEYTSVHRKLGLYMYVCMYVCTRLHKCAL